MRGQNHRMRLIWLTSNLTIKSIILIQTLLMIKLAKMIQNIRKLLDYKPAIIKYLNII